ETEGLLDRMVVRDARLTGLLLVVDEPDLGFRLVVLRKPGALFLPAGDIQRPANFHFVLSAVVDESARRRTINPSSRAARLRAPRAITLVPEQACPPLVGGRRA